MLEMWGFTYLKLHLSIKSVIIKYDSKGEKDFKDTFSKKQTATLHFMSSVFVPFFLYDFT